MRIFLDANVLFFTAKSDRAIWSLLQLLQAEGNALVGDGFVVEWPAVSLWLPSLISPEFLK